MTKLPSLHVEPLSRDHDRSSFSCGVEPLDRYFKTQANQDIKKHMAACFVLVVGESEIGGYYTLSATSINVAALPIESAKGLPRYPAFPATLLGRLAVSQNFQGRGYGRYLLADALWRVLKSEIASFAVVVDVKNENARQFYLRENFLAFAENLDRMFLPVADFEKLFAG